MVIAQDSFSYITTLQLENKTTKLVLAMKIKPSTAFLKPYSKQRKKFKCYIVLGKHLRLSQILQDSCNLPHI